jgi:hypothetical protein
MEGNMDTLFTAYVGASDTSKERAMREDKNGIGHERRNLIVTLLAGAPHGLTWKELSDLTELHHGQVSGALSILHKAGAIAQLRITRNRCHPYIHPRFISHYTEAEIVREPVKTRARYELEALRDLQTVIEGWLDGTDNLDDVREALEIVRTVQG